jgi:hypothetical protein
MDGLETQCAVKLAQLVEKLSFSMDTPCIIKGIVEWKQW